MKRFLAVFIVLLACLTACSTPEVEETPSVVFEEIPIETIAPTPIPKPWCPEFSLL